MADKVRGIIGSTEVESVGRRGQDRSPTGCGIGLTDLLSIGLAPAFLIRRFAPPSPRGKAFRGRRGNYKCRMPSDEW